MAVIDGWKKLRLCDAFPRREFLMASGIGFTGLLPSTALGIAKRTGKSVICIHLEGGLPQMDTFDLKPEGPVDLRGEFSPIRTSVPGMQVCELFPRLAQLAGRYSIIRSIVGNIDAHNFDTTQLGYRGLRMPNPDMSGVGGVPAVGSVISRVLGPKSGMPPFIWDCAGGSQEGVQTGYLGPIHAPSSLQTSLGLFRRRLSVDRIRDRSALLQSLDNLRRDIDSSGCMEATDVFNRQAIDVLMAGKLGEALDLSREDPRTRERYAAGAGRYRQQTERLILARRLVESGVRYVAMNWGGYLGFDSHEANYSKMRQILPPTDAALSVLIEDLYQRGMDQEVLVVVWSEFGRTPRINSKGGRDHWPPVQCALMIGGGLRMGQVIGATDRSAGEPIQRPVHIHEVLSTLYNHLGIDVANTQLVDPDGRPRYLLDVRHPIRELL